MRAIQQAVGGYFDALLVRSELGGCVGLIDEEGALKDKPRNARASGLVAQLSPGNSVVGVMIVFGPSDAHGELTPVPQAVAEELTGSDSQP